jgi:hypothetical protein
MRRDAVIKSFWKALEAINIGEAQGGEKMKREE